MYNHCINAGRIQNQCLISFPNWDNWPISSLWCRATSGEEQIVTLIHRSSDTDDISTIVSSQLSKWVESSSVLSGFDEIVSSKVTQL